MMALALAEDSLSKRERCDEIIDELGKLSDKMREFMQVRLAFVVVGRGLVGGFASHLQSAQIQLTDTRVRV